MEKKKKCQSSDHSEINIQIKNGNQKTGRFWFLFFWEKYAKTFLNVVGTKNHTDFQTREEPDGHRIIERPHTEVPI